MEESDRLLRTNRHILDTRTAVAMFFLLSFVALSPLSSPVDASENPDIDSATAAVVQGTIDRILIDGNKKTSSRTILRYMGIDSSDVYDSSDVAAAEKRLEGSGLFSYVKVLTVSTAGGVTLLVVVREKRYFAISDYGGAIYDAKYGKPVDGVWIQAYGAVSYTNLGGRHEKLDVSASIWTNRSFGLSWYKPFIGTPYFLKLGSVVGTAPSIVTPWHTTLYNSSHVTFGRKFEQYSQIAGTVRGRYMDYEWKGGRGDLTINGKYTGSLPIDPELPPMKLDTHWLYHKIDSIILDGNNQPVDTLYNTYEWKGYSRRKIEKYEEPHTELYLSLGWITDLRDSKFDPSRGAWFSFSALTNALWPYRDINLEEKELRFLQLSSDLRFFHRGFFENNTVAYRVRPLARFFGKGNIYSGVYMGSEGTLRGYRHGAFGSYRYNNRILLSWEYRFRIVNLPELSFPWLTWYHESLSALRSRIDGAVLFDFGHIWQELENPFNPEDGNKSAAGAGAALRFMFPSLARSVCAELVFPCMSSAAYKEHFGENAVWSPTIHLYLDMPF